MPAKVKVPKWIPTTVLVLLVPVIAYLAVSNIEDMRNRQDAGEQSDADARIITFMQVHYNSQHPAAGYHWSVTRRDGSTSLACYCDKNGYGWWYNVQATPDGQFTASEVANTSKGAARQ